MTNLDREPLRTCKCEQIYCEHYPEPIEGRHWWVPFYKFVGWAFLIGLVYGWIFNFLNES